MNRLTESKVINLRVSEAEKQYFERMAQSLEMSLSDLLRYELRNHYLERERAEILSQLKANASNPDAQDKDARRAELLKAILLNISAAANWYKIKVKRYQHEIDRLEKIHAGFEQFEEKMQASLSGK